MAVIGFLLSIYAFYTERKLKKDGEHKSVCDIGEKASCTVAFSSKYGKMLGISNSILGMFFYIAIIALVSLNFLNLVLLLSVIGLLMSLYMAYALYFKLKNFCLVCNLIYLINILIFVFSVI